MNNKKIKYFHYLQAGGDIMNNMKSNFGQYVNVASTEAASLANQFKLANNQPQGDLKRSMKGDAVVNSASNVLMAIPTPVTQIAGAVLKVGQAVGKRVGRIKKDVNISQAVASNSEFGGTTSLSQKAGQDAQTYNQLGMSKMFGHKKRKYSNAIDQANKRMIQARGVMAEGKLAQQGYLNMADQLQTGQQIKYAGGISPVAVGKKGMAIRVAKEVIQEKNKKKRQIEKQKNNQDIASYKEGGSIIVDGKLHSQKHNIELDNISKKGVPIIDIKLEGGEIDQKAEVEKDELILRLEITEKLIELMKDNSIENQIEAGKILAKEIIKNTKDSKSKIIKNA